VIPAKHALIGAICTPFPAARITRVVVLDEREVPIPRSQNQDWNACRLTHGACYADWMKGTEDMTPEWVFSEFAVFHGFADSAVVEQAIAAFAEIEECAWARAMVPTKPTREPTWRFASP
jgi:hypothetical protein